MNQRKECLAEGHNTVTPPALRDYQHRTKFLNKVPVCIMLCFKTKKRMYNISVEPSLPKNILAKCPFYGTSVNSAELDQMPQNAASDQVQHCLLTYCILKFELFVNYYPTTL